MARKYRKLKGTSYDPYAGGPYSGAYGSKASDSYEHRDPMDNLVAWYERPSYVISFLVLFFPVGLFLMWRNMKWNKIVKTIITIVILTLAALYYYGIIPVSLPS